MRKKKKSYRLLKSCIFLAAAIVIAVFASSASVDRETIINTVPSMEYSEFNAAVTNGEITTIYYDKDNPVIYLDKTDSTSWQTQNPEYDTFKQEMLLASVPVKTTAQFMPDVVDKQVPGFISLLSSLLVIIAVGNLIATIIFYSARNRYKDDVEALMKHVNINIGPEAETVAQPTNTTKHQADPSVKTFKNIAGLYEVKKDVKCLVDFLKNKDKYIAAGAELPRGVIFYGPPGTGKTLLAKAIAGEANVPFHYMSGSDFIEMYVGMGAKRVRELFERAKKDAPCIVFIDEIDALGSRKNNGDYNGEDRKTINALLTEMDGFKSTDNVLVIAATNRIEDLDEALLRPGRFTNKFCVPLPETSQERLEVIKLYAANKKIADNVDFDNLASETVGFSPAAIEALLNESAIISVQDGKPFVDRDSLDKAMLKLLLSGHIKEDQANRKKEELEIVAWHEAGHALVGKLIGKKIPKVTILATTSGAGGVTFTTPKQTNLLSVEDLKNEVKELYAGRIAELILLGDKEKVTTGASNDIERATVIIKEIITLYGMTEHYGLLNLNKLKVSQTVIIEKEVELAKQLEDETLKLLNEHKDQLASIANKLLEKETIYDDDLAEIVSAENAKESST